jgi:sugar phosphate isomerase/epimerase
MTGYEARLLGSSIDDIDQAGRLGFDALELGCEASGDPATGPLHPGALDAARGRADDQGVTLTALAYYGLATADQPAGMTISSSSDAASAPPGRRVVESTAIPAPSRHVL